MRISKVRLKGFRNFKDETISFSNKSLIIGCNDIGKSNLLYALRLLLDKGLSDADLDPRDSDFYVYEETNKIEIYIEFEDVCEECVIARLREYVSDGNRTVLAYIAHRASKGGGGFHLYLGKDEMSLKEVQGRYYLKFLCLKFIGSKRDLFTYIRGEKKRLLDDAKQRRAEEDVEKDNVILAEIEKRLGEVNDNVTKLSYIDRATASLNVELSGISFHHSAQEVVFDVGASDASMLVDNLHLASRVNGKNLIVGGDGRNSQIHLALWSARNKTLLDKTDDLSEVNIFCIEEPESHLHPHQQRRLAKYLAEVLNSQVIITTHSPQITCEFPPSSIIHLHRHNSEPDTKSASHGIEDALIKFGHRLNIIPAEAFFSSVVLLVEGTSEVLFYKALAEQIEIDLDRLNVSILMVDGIGFQPYIALLNSLNIPFVVRTDNDIFKTPKKSEYRFAGIQRGLNLCRSQLEEDAEGQLLLQEESRLSGFTTVTPPAEVIELAHKFIELLECFNIYMAEVDLETDLQKYLRTVTGAFFDKPEDQEVVREMQKLKATNMFEFLRYHADSLKALKSTSLAAPLERCREIIKATYATHPRATTCN